MQTYNAENERIKRQYFLYLKEAKRYNEATLDSAAKALNRFEVYTKFRSFKTFHIEQAVGFKRHLSKQMNARTGRPLSKATLYSTLNALRNFFHWLAGRPGFRMRLSYSDSDYFNLSEKETRIAKTHREAQADPAGLYRPTIDLPHRRGTDPHRLGRLRSRSSKRIPCSPWRWSPPRRGCLPGSDPLPFGTACISGATNLAPRRRRRCDAARSQAVRNYGGRMPLAPDHRRGSPRRRSAARTASANATPGLA